MNALEDREVVDVLRDRPELLAVADALASTQRRRHARHPLTVAVAAAVLAGVALVSPWGGRGPDALDEAIAAIGTAPVLHVVIEYSGDDELVVVPTGESKPRVHRMELWHDAARNRFRSKLSTDGVPTGEQVVAEGRACSEAGCVDTGELTAQLEPALAAFATGYRDALQAGAARVTGEMDAMKLLTFTGASGETTTVVVDSATHRPLRFSSTYPGGRRSPTFTVLVAESRARDTSTFTPPGLGKPRASTGTVSADARVTPAEATEALGRPPLWLGDVFAGNALQTIVRQEARTELTRGRAVEGVVVRLRYEDGLGVSLASSIGGAYALGFGDPADPPAGTMAITRDWGGQRRWSAELRVSGFWVALHAPTRAVLLRAARSLAPMEQSA